MVSTWYISTVPPQKELQSHTASGLSPPAFLALLARLWHSWKVVGTLGGGVTEVMVVPWPPISLCFFVFMECGICCATCSCVVSGVWAKPVRHWAQTNLSPQALVQNMGSWQRRDVYQRTSDGICWDWGGLWVERGTHEASSWSLRTRYFPPKTTVWIKVGHTHSSEWTEQWSVAKDLSRRSPPRH